MRALMTTLILSINWFRVRNVHKTVTEPHVKFHERHEFVTFRYIESFVRIWSWNAWRSVVRKNSLLQTVRCAKLAHENCYVVSQHPLWTSYFYWRKYFHCAWLWCQNNRVYVPPMNKETRIEWLTLVSHFAALCLCEQLLYMTCILLGLQLNTAHQYNIWNARFVANLPCYNSAKYF